MLSANLFVHDNVLYVTPLPYLLAREVGKGGSCAQLLGDCAKSALYVRKAKGGGQVFTRKTLGSILEGTRWTEADLKRLGILK